MHTRKLEKNVLTHGTRRIIHVSRTAQGVMANIKYGRIEISGLTAAEAEKIAKALAVQESAASQPKSLLEALAALGTPSKDNPWKRATFWQFMANLGESQTQVLRLLVTKRRIAADDLRKAVRANNFQELAGTLSGVSKQAGALNMSARHVFLIENNSQSGQITKTYIVAPEFLQIALDQNWPED